MMKTKRATRVLALAIVFLAFYTAACGDSTGPSERPGQLTVSVSTAGNGGAAFLITVTGNSITNPVAANSNHEVFALVSGTTLTAAVITPAAVTSGALLKFSVPDVNVASSYGVTLVEVAGTDNALQSASSYTLTIAN